METIEVNQEKVINSSEEISSKDNQYIKLAKSLHEKKYRKEKNQIIFEGLTLIKEALKRKVKIERIFYEKDYILEDLTELENIELHKIDAELMQKVSSTDSAAPIVAIAQKPDFKDPMRQETQLSLLENPKQEKKTTGNLFVFCEKIQDPGNLGSIIRTAFSAGVEALYLSHDCADIFNPKTIRSSMGAIFCAPVIYKDLKDLKEELKNFSSKNETSYEIIATSSHAQKNYKDLNINKLKNFLLLIGNESKGLSEDTLKEATMSIKIDLANDIESLNVLAATSIILFEIKNKLN